MIRNPKKKVSISTTLIPIKLNTKESLKLNQFVRHYEFLLFVSLLLCWPFIIFFLYLFTDSSLWVRACAGSRTFHSRHIKRRQQQQLHLTHFPKLSYIFCLGVYKFSLLFLVLLFSINIFSRIFYYFHYDMILVLAIKYTTKKMAHTVAPYKNNILLWAYPVEYVCFLYLIDIHFSFL